MVLEGLDGLNCHHPHTTCASNDLLRLNWTRVDPSGPSLPDVTNEEGIGCYAYLDAGTFVEYDWELRTAPSFFILNPEVR